MNREIVRMKAESYMVEMVDFWVSIDKHYYTWYKKISEFIKL